MDDSKDKPDAKSKKKGSSKLLIIVLIAAVAVLSVAITLFLPRLGVGPWAKHGDASGEKEKEKEKNEPPAAVAVLDAIVVDLRESGGDIHHLKVGIAIELKGELHGEEFKRYEPRARDAAISYLRTLTFEEVTASANMERIRKTLGDRVAAAVGKTLVRNVLFTDFVAQ